MDSIRSKQPTLPSLTDCLIDAVIRYTNPSSTEPKAERLAEVNAAYAELAAKLELTTKHVNSLKASRRYIEPQIISAKSTMDGAKEVINNSARFDKKSGQFIARESK